MNTKKKKTILVVDDQEIDRGILCEICKGKYHTIEAGNGEDALVLLRQQMNDICMVLLDIIMPKKDGFAVLKEMKGDNLLQDIPVLMITAEDSIELVKKCYMMGASEVIRKPFDAYIVSKTMENMTELYYYKQRLEARVEEQTKILRMQFVALQKQSEQLKGMNEQIVDTLSQVVEFRNLESGQHVKRIKTFTRILAECVAEHYQEYHLGTEEIENITSASALHDVGKIAIPDTILLKPTRLTSEEYEIMKEHTTKGCEIIDTLAEIQDKKFQQISYDICRHHHERYDGKGYPDGMKGEEIPIAAQIVSVADVYDALVSERVYKAAFDKETAFHMILNGECGTFSPKLMKCLTLVKDKFEEVADAMKD